MASDGGQVGDILRNMVLRLLLATFLLVQSVHAPAQAREAVREYLGALRTERGFPGASAAVVWADGSSFTVTVGSRDEAGTDPLRDTDLLLAGSIGKTVVSALILRSVQAGEMDLDRRVAWWLGSEPWFRDVPNAGRVTLRQLMNHTAGIPEHVRDLAFARTAEAEPDRVWRPADWIGYVRGVDRIAPPGEQFSYADTNYILAALAYERATGRTMYGEAKRMLAGLRIGQIVPSDSRRVPGLIAGHARPIPPFTQQGPTIVDGLCRLNPQLEYAGGGFASTPRGLATWAMAVYGGRVIRPGNLENLRWLEGVPANTGPGDHYGLGVQIRQSSLGVSYGHGGWFPGYLSEMAYFPDRGFAVAVQFNTDDGRRIGRRPYQVLVDIAERAAKEQSRGQTESRRAMLHHRG